MPANAKASPSPLLRFLLVSLVLAVHGVAWWLHPAPQPSGFVTGSGSGNAATTAPAVSASAFASSDAHGYIHSPAITSLPDGSLLAAWFTGSREGAGDVEIRGARRENGQSRWGPERTLVTRSLTQEGTQRLIRKLGNPVLATAPDGRVWLFFVSVSLGGWATSNINAMFSDDLGTTWSRPTRLHTSPFLNLSTLVRMPPLFHADGSIGLPVYHEMAGKFGEYLMLDRDGNVTGKYRISHGRSSLQPAVVALDGQRAVALLRYAGKMPGFVMMSRTQDAGRTWSDMEPTLVPNPNSSLAASRWSSGRVLVAANDTHRYRYRLGLHEWSEKEGWRMVGTLESPDDGTSPDMSRDQLSQALRHRFDAVADPSRQHQLDVVLSELDRKGCKRKVCRLKFDYPFMIESGNGQVELVYNWNNSFIKHVTLDTGRSNPP